MTAIANNSVFKNHTAKRNRRHPKSHKNGCRTALITNSTEDTQKSASPSSMSQEKILNSMQALIFFSETSQKH